MDHDVLSMFLLQFEKTKKHEKSILNSYAIVIVDLLGSKCFTHGIVTQTERR